MTTRTPSPPSREGRLRFSVLVGLLFSVLLAVTVAIALSSTRAPSQPPGVATAEGASPSDGAPIDWPVRVAYELGGSTWVSGGPKYEFHAASWQEWTLVGTFEGRMFCRILEPSGRLLESSPTSDDCRRFVAASEPRPGTTVYPHPSIRPRLDTPRVDLPSKGADSALWQLTDRARDARSDVADRARVAVDSLRAAERVEQRPCPGPALAEVRCRNGHAIGRVVAVEHVPTGIPLLEQDHLDDLLTLEVRAVTVEHTSAYNPPVVPTEDIIDDDALDALEFIEE